MERTFASRIGDVHYLSAFSAMKRFREYFGLEFDLLLIKSSRGCCVRFFIFRLKFYSLDACQKLRSFESDAICIFSVHLACGSSPKRSKMSTQSNDDYKYEALNAQCLIFNSHSARNTSTQNVDWCQYLLRNAQPHTSDFCCYFHWCSCVYSQSFDAIMRIVNTEHPIRHTGTHTHLVRAAAVLS